MRAPTEEICDEGVLAECARPEVSNRLIYADVLALERRFESFSHGRGRITPDRIATRHCARPTLRTGRSLAYSVSFLKRNEYQ